MRFSSAILALAASLAPASGSLFARGNQAVITDDDLKIPGDSPLELCPKEHDKDIVTIQSVNLTPNPPQAYVFCWATPPLTGPRFLSDT